MYHSSEIHSAGEKLTEYLTGWQRARAGLANFRERMFAEQDLRDKKAKRKLIEEMIPLIDNFESMVKHVPADLRGNQWVEGVMHIAKQLENILNQYEVVTIKKAGENFDPRIHEALEIVVGDKGASGKVVEVVQQGFVMGDDVIRAAKVKVAK